MMLSQSIAYLSADRLDAIASLGTLTVALFVLWEARHIRTSDGIFRQNQAWNEFGNAVAKLEKGSRIGELLMGKEIPRGLIPSEIGDNLNPREAFLLMSFFNVVSSEYYAFRAGAIDEQYVIHSLSMTAKFVKRNQVWIFRFLREYGYEGSFRRVVAIVALAGDDPAERRTAIKCELFARTLRGRICRILLPRWRRSPLDEDQIQLLCAGT